MLDVEQQSYVMIPLNKIVSKLPVRRLSTIGITRIMESMRWAGFLENYPLIIAPLEDGTYQLIDGNHRYEAAKGLGSIFSVPCIIKDDLSDLECYQMAMQSNSAAETVVPSTLVTYAEFIWARLEETDENDKKKYTQSDVGQMLGWDRASIRDYAALRKICPEAWQIIGATFEKTAPIANSSMAPTDGAMAPFTERLLRSILDLTAKQQIELVTDLINNPNFSKGKFKTLAENYQARNEMKKYTQSDVGKMLGWSRGQISQYALLDKIDKKAWEIVATAFDNSVAGPTDTSVASNATGVAFSEFLLRDINTLLPDQQLELVRDLATGKIEKGAFTKLAKAYKTRNDIKSYAIKQIGILGETYTTKANATNDTKDLDYITYSVCDENTPNGVAGGHIDGTITLEIMTQGPWTVDVEEWE